MNTDRLFAFVRLHAQANRRLIETAAEPRDDEQRRIALFVICRSSRAASLSQ